MRTGTHLTPLDISEALHELDKLRAGVMDVDQMTTTAIKRAEEVTGSGTLLSAYKATQPKHIREHIDARAEAESIAQQRGASHVAVPSVARLPTPTLEGALPSRRGIEPVGETGAS
jgi:hypothetical protein